MRKALYNPDGSFIAALREDIETDIPFVLVTDEEAIGLTSRHVLVNGEWVFVPPPPPTSDELWAPVRQQRNQLLRNSDWTQIPDSPLAAQKKQQWMQYRQALRDVTNQADPENIVWPTPPA